MDEARGRPAPTAAGGLDQGADGRSPYRTTCPYFRHEGPEGALLAPIERPDSANRCAAIGWPVEPSLRQQAMFCLSSEHDSCPRYVHAEATPDGSIVPVLPQRPQPRDRAPRRPPNAPRPRSPATLAALLLLLASASLSFAVVLVRGGLTLPTPSGPPDNVVAGATGTPLPTTVAAVPTAVPATPTPLPTPAPTAEPTPTVPPSLAPTPTPAPVRTATPRPRSTRYAYLDPCPARPNCWLYTIRRGDALSALANYFGHPLSTIHRLNPWTKTRGIQPGDQLILPPPTR